MNEAKTIRDALKAELGLTARQVGVRTSGGGSVNITIKDPTVVKSKVEAIAKRSEHIDRCSVTQEILGGGNTFVFVKYSDAARATMAAPYLAAVEAAAADIRGQSITPIGETGYGLSNTYDNSSRDGLFKLWAPDRGGHIGERRSEVRMIYDASCVESAAFSIALDLLELSA